MGKVIATIKVMPESLKINLEKLKEKITKLIEGIVEVGRVEEEEIAFGLKSLNFIVIADETKGSLDPLAEKIAEIKGVKSAEVTNVTRAIG